MAADRRGALELLALIHQHLLRGGFARAARELQAQTGQKLLPSLSASLEDIFTHWEKTPSNSRRRKVSDDEEAIPEKIRVPDPVSSSESSDKEEDEKEKAKAANAVSLPLATNSGVNVESSEEDDSSSEEETPAGKGAVVVPPAVVSGKAATNSLHSLNIPTAPAGKTAVPSAANRTVVSNKQQPNAPAASPAKAGQKLPGPGKPGHATTATTTVGQSKPPVSTKARESSSSSSSSESDEEKEAPAAKGPAPRVEAKQAAGAAESSSEESSDETSEEEELATPVVQTKTAVKTVPVNAGPVKSVPATPASLKKTAVRQTAVAPTQAKPAPTTVPATVSGAAKPDDTSESSDSSDSEDEELPSVTQTKPPPKSSQAVPSPVKPTPAASLSGKAAPGKTLPLSQGKPTPKPAVPKQAKTTPARTAAPTKPAESAKPVESTDSSGSEEEDHPVPISQKRLIEQPRPVPNLSQTPKAVGSTLKSQTSESGSSDTSDSEEEAPAAQTQPLQAVKTNAVPQPTSIKKAPAPAAAPAPPPVESSDDSSKESDSEEEVVPPSQILPQQNIKAAKVSSAVTGKANATLPPEKGTEAPPAPPVIRVSKSSSSDSSDEEVAAEKVPTASSLKQTVPVGKAPPASAATLQAAPLLGSPTAKLRKPGLKPEQHTHPNQAVPPTQAEEPMDSSSSDSSDEEAPKQPPRPGSLQKPGGTQPAHSSSSESSEEEEEEEAAAASQSLLTGYLGPSRTPATPQTPKTVPLQPVGKAGQGKAAVTAANSHTRAPVKAAPANSSSSSGSDSSDSDTDVDQVATNHKAESSRPTPGQEATGASNTEKVARKTEPDHASLKPSPVKKALAVKENDVGAKGAQMTPASSAPFSVPQSEESSLETETETAGARVPSVQNPVEGLEGKKKKKKEKKEKKEKKKPSSTADKAVKAAKSKDKENKKQKTSHKRKHPEEDGAVGQPKEKKGKVQANEEVPKKKKKKVAGELGKLPGSKEKKKGAKKKKTGKEKKKGKKVTSEGDPVADGSAEVHKKKKKKKTAEPEGL
ncbi:treacle protein isoform X2 [Lathamus discolor]|uniref:treacle protein isoform X2 n=1 Tax=Lathamus discolor TaxID=678569 RepID=UPI0032B7CB32